MHSAPLRLERARDLIDEGRPEQAIRLLRGSFPALLAAEREFLAAEALRSQGYFDRADALYRDLLSRPSQEDAELWLDACLGLVSVLRSLGKTSQARFFWRKGAAQARADEARRERFALEDALIDRAQGLYARSLVKLGRFLKKSRKAGDWGQAGFVLWAMGGARRFSGDLDGSRRDFLESLASFRQAGDEEGMAYAWFGLGGVLRIQGRFEPAERAYVEAGRRLQATQDIFGKAYAQCGLANVLRQRGRLDAAYRRYLSAHKLYSRLGDAVDLAYVDWGLGQVHLKRGELDAAEKRFAAALKAFSAFNEERGVCLSENALAAVWHAKGRTKEAEALFDRSVARARRAGLHAHLEVFS